MKTAPDEQWQCDLSIYITKDGAEFRLKDGRTTLTDGADARQNQSRIAEMALEAATKAKAEADGVKAS